MCTYIDCFTLIQYLQFNAVCEWQSRQLLFGSYTHTGLPLFYERKRLFKSKIFFYQNRTQATWCSNAALTTKPQYFSSLAIILKCLPWCSYLVVLILPRPWPFCNRSKDSSHCNYYYKLLNILKPSQNSVLSRVKEETTFGIRQQTICQLFIKWTLSSPFYCQRTLLTVLLM